jgi:hypothetical protein
MKKLLALIPILLMATAVFAVPNKEPTDSVTLIHYIDGRVKLVGGGSCSKLLGVKWGSLPVSYVINPTNGPSDVTIITTAISAATAEWDSHTNAILFDGYTIDNVGWGINDKKNAYVFGSYSGNNNVIAVTKYWYTRYGKQIVDYDVLFNTFYGWFDCTKTTCTADNKGMDLQTIALHETGHGIGLADVYNRACGDTVMYGYGSYGEIKRDLAQPDINGLVNLYGA